MRPQRTDGRRSNLVGLTKKRTYTRGRALCPASFFFGVRRQSERTALWVGWGKSGVALRLPPHSKERLANRSQCGVRALPPAWERSPQPRSSARMKTTFGLLEAPRAAVERKKAAMVRIDFDMACAMSTAANGCRPFTSGAQDARRYARSATTFS